MHDQSSSDDQTRGSATTRAGPSQSPPLARLIERTIGESLRLQTDVANFVMYQMRQTTRAQAENAALFQQLLTNTTAWMPWTTPSAESTRRSRAARSADSAEESTDEQDTEKLETPTAERLAESPALRRTPTGELAFKRWEPPQLSVEPPERERMRRQREQERGSERADESSAVEQPDAESPAGRPAEEAVPSDSGQLTDESSDTDQVADDLTDEADAESEKPVSETN